MYARTPPSLLRATALRLPVGIAGAVALEAARFEQTQHPLVADPALKLKEAAIRQGGFRRLLRRSTLGLTRLFRLIGSLGSHVNGLEAGRSLSIRYRNGLSTYKKRRCPW